ncbi:MAG: iron-sulfur cluster assembly accessory protein [Thermostichus sp. DG_1_6_bins_120]
MITVTDSAVQELKRLRSKYEKDGAEPILRLGVKPSGCSGLSYVMNFESQANPDDQTFEFDGLRVAVDPLSMTLISGITVDFSEDLLGGGFRFKNPNAVASCGCGTSFAISETAAAAGH